MDQKSYTLRSDGDDSKTPEQIRSEIGATRAALDRTVTEIEHRLQPRHLVEEVRSAAANRVRQAGVAARDAARTAAEQAFALGYRTADRVRRSPGTSIAATAGCLVAVALTLWGVKRMRGRNGARARR